jgi:hypothetical protein
MLQKFSLFQQPTDLLRELHQLVWIFLMNGLLTEPSPTFFCFSMHLGLSSWDSEHFWKR